MTHITPEAGMRLAPCPFCGGPAKLVRPMGDFVGKERGVNGGHYGPDPPAETGAVGTSAASEQNGGGADPIKAALDAYHDALIRRENGNIAGFRLIDAIEAHYGQSMDTRRTALAAGGEK